MLDNEDAALMQSLNIGRPGAKLHADYVPRVSLSDVLIAYYTTQLTGFAQHSLRWVLGFNNAPFKITFLIRTGV
jgi:hypothetical protein